MLKQETPAAPVQSARQLAAIMFTDMTGYTALMQEDEQKAKVLRDRQRQSLEYLHPISPPPAQMMVQLIHH